MLNVLLEESVDPVYTPSSSLSSLTSRSLSAPPQNLPPSLLSQLSSLRHFIPVLPRSASLEGSEDNKLPAQLSPHRRPAGICLNVNSLPDIYAEDGSLHDSELLMQLSPASAIQFGYNGTSPTTVSTLSALRRFLPSNFDKDGLDACQYDIYSGDEFRMYEFKVRRCMRGRSHDWTECPFAHPGEKARRRDPRRYHYSGLVCADYKKGSCKKGDACDLAHGVFECWLHPSRYRTQPCKDGRGCRRRICFFAHTPDQLRVVSPTSSPSSSPLPAYMHSTAMETPLEAFELSSPLSPAGAHCKLVQSSRSESPQMSSLTSPRLAIADAFSASSLSPRSLPFDLYTSVGDLSSPHEGSMESGLSNFMLPIPTSGEFYQSPQSSRTQATMPSHNGMLLDRLKSSLSFSNPSFPKGSQSAASPAAMHASQKIEDLVRLLRQLDLAQNQDTLWQEGKGSMMSPPGFGPQRCARSVPVTPTNTRCRVRDGDEMMFNGGFYDDADDVGEPRLERVESGKGLRAQIFESLLSSASASGL